MVKHFCMINFLILRRNYYDFPRWEGQICMDLLCKLKNGLISQVSNTWPTKASHVSLDFDQSSDKHVFNVSES